MVRRKYPGARGVRGIHITSENFVVRLYAAMASGSCAKLGVALVLLLAAAAVADASTTLPRHPETVCGALDVRTAFTRCKLLGPVQACCEGLDAVFANSSSPASGCLCFPQVLYQIAATASQAGLDALGVLTRCRQQHNFQTQWATATPTDCPDIPISADASDLINLFGDEVVLSGAKSRTTWSWGNLLQVGEVMEELPDVRGVWQKLFGVEAFKLMLLVMISTGPVFGVLHMALMRSSSAYAKLGAAERFIVCQHSAYAVVFSLSLIPQTWLALTALFKSWTGAYLASSQLTALCALFLSTRALLYIVEVCYRSVFKRSWLLVVHHELFFLVIVLGVWTQDAAVVGIGIVLDLFACHEAGLYVALMSYRLQWPAAVTRVVLRISCAWYVITRVFQTAILVYMIVGFARMPHIRLTGEFIVTAILCAAFTFIQAYTLVIYRSIDRKLSARLDASAPVKASADCDKVVAPTVRVAIV